MTYQLSAIDRFEIFVLMDNVSDPFTKMHDGMRWNEFQYQYDVRQQTDMCGANMCRACNGLSLLFRIYTGNQKHTILFDTGPDENLAVENAQRMGIDLTEIEAIILSHGHFDHYGGVLSMLDAIGKNNLPVYAHPELFVPRAFQRKEMIKVTQNISITDIENHGGKVFTARNPTLLFNNTALITGEIPRKTSYEKGTPECRLNNNQWINSPEVIDEQCLIFHLKNKGLCVFTGCGHTGVINAASHAKILSNINKLHVVMGGFHLAGPAFKDRIQPTINDFNKFEPDFIITGHCTGRQMQMELTQAFGDKHVPYAVGTVFSFSDKP